MNEKELWQGVNERARKALTSRNYKSGDLAERIAGSGVQAGELVGAARTKPPLNQAWIPGVEVFSRTVHSQPHRGTFAELVRQDEGVLAKIGLWPKQWSGARMFAQSAKGFHLHPPNIPDDIKADDWHRKLFVEEPENFSLRRYNEEQWDVMFFLQGRAEMFLRDVRAGLPPRTMRFFVDGDDRPTGSNVGIVIPPGVGHAVRAEGSSDVIMVYGTSTTFRPDFEGRIASEIETAALPEGWVQFLSS